MNRSTDKLLEKFKQSFRDIKNGDTKTVDQVKKRLEDE